MPRSGISDLPLHGGDAPKWLFTRMVKLAAAISEIVIDERGTLGLLERMSDPYWFQAYSCVLGFDWHSSGTTTVTCGAMKEAMNTSDSIGVAGGKGNVSRRAPAEIGAWCEVHGLHSSRENALIYASRMSAKVDNAALQDGHQLYHHCLFFDTQGNWTVVQQGLCDATGYARRYQWHSNGLRRFVDEPHTAISGQPTQNVLDMTAAKSEAARDASVDLVNDGVERLKREIVVVEEGQSTLSEFAGDTPLKLHMPRGINWEVLRRAYEFHPTGYEELLGVEGVGPATVRALAMISELIYGTEASWKDPVKFSFAVGGKDGVPFPVDRKAMDRSTEMLRAGIEGSRLGDKEKLDAIARLRRFVPPDHAW
ncbi:MAG TPA: DUF763 domain-containing protein [Methanomassiliicoccales archaeon]|nr:DUF763 domain-containing protein [Methanomassiliicoccales archaeon]